MARTAYPSKAVAGGSTAIDTAGYGTVTIVGTATADSASITVTASDTLNGTYSSVGADLINPISGTQAVTGGLSSGLTVIGAYVGPKRYIKAVGSSANVIVVLGEPRQGWSNI